MTRAEQIASTYSLTHDGECWVATQRFGDGSAAHFRSPSKEWVIRSARALWGHFDFEDEARAFDAIFRVSPR